MTPTIPTGADPTSPDMRGTRRDGAAPQADPDASSRRNDPWPQERLDELVRLWADGFTAAEIARRFGDITRNAVLGKVHRAPELFARRKQSNRRGQPRLKYDHGAALNMWAAGKSAREIAAAQGMSIRAANMIVATARMRGDARAIPHPRSGRFVAEANRRGMTPTALRSALLRTIRADNLFDAVLGAPGERQ
jgi:hypothetical protein